MTGAPPGTAIPTPPFDITAGFYAALGFAERGRWGDEYLIVARDALELHFYEDRAVDPCTSNAGC